jgi:hypothetical protein
MRGMIVSADQVSPNSESGFVSFKVAGMIQYQNNPRIFNETVIEQIRARYFQNPLSRMRGVYFFQSREEAKARIDDRNWPTYFQNQNLVELELHYKTPPTIVDANCITFAELDRSFRIKQSDTSWINRYWSGEKYNDEPVRELIAKGIALVVDEGVRRRRAEAVQAKIGTRRLRHHLPAPHRSALPIAGLWRTNDDANAQSTTGLSPESVKNRGSV